MEISGGIDICQISLPTGATAILLLACILSLLSTNCPAQKIAPDSRTLNPNNIVLFACCWLTGFLGRITQRNRSDATQGFRQLPLPQEGFAFFTVKNLTFPMHPYGSQTKGMGGQHHIFKDAASILYKGVCGAICQDQDHDRRAIVGVCAAPHYFCV